ncbi:unnamed protein product [Spirodela intermedia]|uniref:Endonuclease/exonuclease/phosphatase domain-containing protein n=1 Tax=Spirodela intermedia TaxID=51605 RepID=A0A7I8JDS6_SPIIN|nr:unnamed protein product [Spirodela intermedia]CAA6668259.1 unnamed protein product [Spirodela intermedia]
MKRFFQPVAKEGSSKKPALSGHSGDEGVGGREGSAAPGEEAEKRGPLKFLTWNANSLLLRVKNDWPEFSKFVQELDPDAICIQEVRMPAAGSKGAAKNPSELKDDTSLASEEKQVLMRALSSAPFKSYRVWWSLSDSKYGGTALIVKRQFQPKRVSFSLDPTYDENSFKRRRKWDKRMLEFILQSSDKPLIWCGDLNVSHQVTDVSHPDFFIGAKLNGYVPPNTEDCGQPGFTLAERQRFTKILSLGKLVDAYRYLHEEQDMDGGFSWSGNPVGKYRGKRMRIDYFIVSEQLRDRIVACQIHGRGIELEGSDHCPVSLELLPKKD